MEKTLRCPCCGKEIKIKISGALIQRAVDSPTGKAAVFTRHGSENIVVYVDSLGRIVDAECIKYRPGSLIEEIREIPIPSKRARDPRMLTREEWRFLVLCDGKMSIREISLILGIPYQRARLIAEKLRNMGFIERINLKV